MRREHRDALADAEERMAKKIEAMSNGRLKIKVYGAGEIVPAMEVFDGEQWAAVATPEDMKEVSACATVELGEVSVGGPQLLF